MTNSKKEFPEGIKNFIKELEAFAGRAEATLKQIETSLEANKHLFGVFTERMIAIRGTALQLNLDAIAAIAALGEEISVKAETAQTRPQIRKCIGALWDALSTVTHMLHHYDEETTEEQEILKNRLRKTLDSFGGARETVSMDEIEKLLKGGS